MNLNNSVVSRSPALLRPRARFACGAIVTEPNSEASPPVAKCSAICHPPIIHHARDMEAREIESLNQFGHV